MATEAWAGMSRSQAGRTGSQLLCDGAVSDLQDEEVPEMFHNADIRARDMVKMVKFTVPFLPLSYLLDSPKPETNRMSIS